MAYSEYSTHMSQNQRPTKEQLARYAHGFNQSSAMQLFGAKLSFPDLETVQVELDPITPAHRGGLGTEAVNGGVLSALFDLAIGCTPALIDPSRRSATIQLNIHFMRPTHGNKINVIGKLKRAGGSTVFSTASVVDEEGNVCATCDGIARMGKEPWNAHGTPAFD